MVIVEVVVAVAACAGTSLAAAVDGAPVTVILRATIAVDEEVAVTIMPEAVEGED